MRRWRKAKKKTDSKIWAEYLIQLSYDDSDENNMSVLGRRQIKNLLKRTSPLTAEVMKQYYQYKCSQAAIADNLKISKYRVAKIINFQRTRVIQDLGETECQTVLNFGGD